MSQDLSSAAVVIGDYGLIQKQLGHIRFREYDLFMIYFNNSLITYVLGA